MKNNELCGVILAAGKGTRINTISTMYPKPALPILNKPLIYHQLKIFHEAGIRDVFIVIGHMGYRIVDIIEKENDFDLNIKYFEQEATLGIAHSVGCLEPMLDRPFLLFLGDIYLFRETVGNLVKKFNETGADTVLGSVTEPDIGKIKKSFGIVLNENNDILRVIEKPRFPQTSTKGVGLYLFKPEIFDAIRRTPRTAMRDEYEITDSIQIMIDLGYRVVHANCAESDVNVTYPKDLLRTNLDALDAINESALVHPEAVISKDVKVQRSLVGRGATVGAGTSLKNTMVFPHCVVAEGMSIENSIVTESAILKI